MRSALLGSSLLVLLAASGASSFADDPAPTTPKPPVAPGAKEPAPAPVVSVPTYANSTCPIMGKPASKALFVDTACGRIYVCCPPCMAKIKTDPERACKAAYPVAKRVGNAIDPVTGEKVGDSTATVTLQGYEIALASADHAKPAQANAQVVLTKALKPDVVDVGNGTDPITGTPVVANAFVLVDHDLIRLSSPAVVEAVRRDPEGARKAAKEIAAKEAEARAKEKTKEAGGTPSR
jgi:hypothetical protein